MIIRKKLKNSNETIRKKLEKFNDNKQLKFLK